MAKQLTTEKIVPYRDSNLSKKEQVANMFDGIAFRYDLLNRLLSAGIDKSWRKKAILKLKPLQPQYILDVATGTADVAMMTQKLLHPKKITGIDISRSMLQLGESKIRQAGMEKNIELIWGDSETINFPDNTFDAVTVAFGVRNFENLEKGLAEMLRVLKPGGQVVILEFSRPSVFPVKQLFNFYFRYITPGIGKWIAHSKEAYSYLPDSVRSFPQGKEMIKILTATGYQSATCKPLTFGICSIYSAYK
jgi:demethylmenaquinone methyltransferase / 2-methoxy-6-polyprenyl-1,4-benzoquinol methylase